MAPEIVMGRPYDFGVDVWSLGVCIYFILAGRFPWVFETGGSSNKRKAKDPVSARKEELARRQQFAERVLRGPTDKHHWKARHWSHVSEGCTSLLRQMLEPTVGPTVGPPKASKEAPVSQKQRQRATIEELLAHPWFCTQGDEKPEESPPTRPLPASVMNELADFDRRNTAGAKWHAAQQRQLGVSSPPRHSKAKGHLA